jgi:hypothetical protein
MPLNASYERARRLAVLTLVLGVAAAGAAAASGAHSSAARSDTTFCQLVTGYSSTSFSPVGNTLSPGALKSDFSKLKTEEPKLVSLTPTSIRADMQKVLAFDNVYISEIGKVGWVPAKVPVSFDITLAKDAIPVKPASAAVISYEDKACGLKLPIP